MYIEPFTVRMTQVEKQSHLHTATRRLGDVEDFRSRGGRWRTDGGILRLTGLAGSVGAASPKHCRNCLEQNKQVSSQRPIPDVLRLQRDNLLEVRHLVAPGHLPR